MTVMLNNPSDDDVRRALADNAHKLENGRWFFDDSTVTHSEKDSLAIARACLILGLPVQDTITSGAWLRIVEGMLDLNQRVLDLERAAESEWERRMGDDL